MITMQGKGVSPGIAKGMLLFLRRPETAIERRTVQHPERELQRVEAAQREAVRQLEALAASCRARGAQEAGVLFETHAMLVRDEDIDACIRTHIEGERCCAEYAVAQAGERFAGMLAALDDAYMQARAVDVRDVTGRILRNLGAVSETDGLPDVPVILAADDLTPSETLRLDRSLLLGFVTRGGSDNSHTAILARAMGIPAVCAVGEGLSEDWSGMHGYIDGTRGTLILQPDAATAATLDERIEAMRAHARLLAQLRGLEDITEDGRRVMLYCNIGSPADMDAVREHDGRGIGLFRSEFLYLHADDYPTEEQQLAAYRTVAAAMEGARVIIRTLDIGADKQAAYFGLAHEENPALGMRAVRISLTRPALLHTQLRALYRASAFGRVAIMFPMITAVWEVRACREACRRVMEELDREGVAYRRDTEIGIMIETPAAVLIADELAREVDFFSVGTNDLTQYLLACDRQSSELDRFYDPHHPALLRALRMTADAAHAAGIWVGICGELAADVRLLPQFLEMGIDELSVAPSAVLPLRAAIRKSRAYGTAHAQQEISSQERSMEDGVFDV